MTVPISWTLDALVEAFEQHQRHVRGLRDQTLHGYVGFVRPLIREALGADPIVISGSANFSEASTTQNDENMLVIRGDKRIADIYFGEYLRLYTHYAFRESVKFFMEKKKHGTPEDWQPQLLGDDDSWMEPYFDPHDRSARDTRRKYFGGPMSVSDTSH